MANFDDILTAPVEEKKHPSPRRRAGKRRMNSDEWAAKKKGAEQGAPQQMDDGELSFVEFICEEQRCSAPFFKGRLAIKKDA